MIITTTTVFELSKDELQDIVISHLEDNNNGGLDTTSLSFAWAYDAEEDILCLELTETTRASND